MRDMFGGRRTPHVTSVLFMHVQAGLLQCARVRLAVRPFGIFVKSARDISKILEKAGVNMGHDHTPSCRRSISIPVRDSDLKRTSCHVLFKVHHAGHLELIDDSASLVDLNTQ